MNLLHLPWAAIAAFHVLTLTLPTLVVADFPPPVTYSKVVHSPIDPDITISYKQPDPGTCTTAYATQKQYTGYITLPPLTLAPIQQNYSINTFFWFVEARESPETAPLTIWMNGGPGSSSMIGLFQENGPCEVVQLADGSYGTQSRMWGWDRSSNVLYVDQPAQVGFSYDSLNNATRDMLQAVNGPPSWSLTSGKVGYPAYRFLNGTFSSDDLSATANTTQIAAHAVWHFLQCFLAAFPQYNPGTRPNSTAVNATGINLFAESFGGKYGPTFADVFEQLNDKRANRTLKDKDTLEIKLASLGILNGLVDYLVQGPYNPQFAYNSTYGIEALSKQDMQSGMQKFETDCRPRILACRSANANLDPDNDGDAPELNSLCSSALHACSDVLNMYGSSGRSFYDITQMEPSPFPSSAYLEYLNNGSVLASIGAKVNYTSTSMAVLNTFTDTGDEVRGGQLESLAGLLKRGIRVAMLYGDSDYILNWVGGEQASFALAQLLPETYGAQFPQAGYADIVVNRSYVGGVVRQYGNLSFARIYDSGHLIPSYQPETAFTIFTRIIQGSTDLATGFPVDATTFRSKGPANSTYRNAVPRSQDAVCWIRDMRSTCSNPQRNKILLQQGVVLYGVLYDSDKDFKRPSASIKAGVPGRPLDGELAKGETVTVSAPGTDGKGTTTTVAPTGVYSATDSPAPTRKNDAEPGFLVEGQTVFSNTYAVALVAALFNVAIEGV